jgi:hypothetical protein
MPIEIKELHIRAVIANEKQDTSTSLKQEDISKLKKDITKEVTEKIMNMLKQKNER